MGLNRTLQLRIIEPVMIIIEHPIIDFRGEEVYLSAIIKEDNNENTFSLWFSVDKKYGEFFCDDRADAFMLSVLMIAMKSHQDVCINAPVSKLLLFNINNMIQPLFAKMMPNSSCINIIANAGYCSKLDGFAVGCGCSLGVDSLSALYHHMGEKVLEGYNVTHLALFNSGQLGYLDKEKDELAFKNAVEAIVPFAQETDLPIVAVNTNINEFFVRAGFKTAVSRFIVSTIACPLTLQKLFGKYVYASSFSVVDFGISKTDQSHSEAVFVPLLSTESLEVVLSSAVMTRVEKTDYIRKFPLTSKYLDVCWAVQLASSQGHEGKWLKEKTKKNCGWCDKCLRTLFTLELLGEDLQKYESIFDLPKYYAHKNTFIKTMLSNRHRNVMYNEIYTLIQEKKYRIPLSLRIQSSFSKSNVIRVLKKLKLFLD